MFKYFKKIINWREIDLGDEKKNEEFYKSLRELITILFAVVLGVGLSQLKEYKGTYDLVILIIAYTAVILSWWGWHYGIIKGPRETNALNYLIDFFLLVLYWLLINKRAPLFLVLLMYCIMFLLYYLWELIRKDPLHLLKKARKLNLYFLLIFIVMFISYLFWEVREPGVGKNWCYIVALFVIIITYRISICRLYSAKKSDTSFPSIPKEDMEKTLIEKAKAVAMNARVHLSGFRVGAAILSDTGKIYVGCNVEFDNYSNTIHAEENALSSMIADGDKCPVSIVVFTFDDKLWFPCGMCRQSLFELGGKDLKVITCNEKGCEIKTMGELLPGGFHL